MEEIQSTAGAIPVRNEKGKHLRVVTFYCISSLGFL